MKRIKLMADYQCYPLWENSPGEYGDISPGSLPISDSLRDDLLAWAEAYDKIIDINDHTNIGFKSQDEVDCFKHTGYELADRLQKELGDDYEVVHNIIAGRKKSWT